MHQLEARIEKTVSPVTIARFGNRLVDLYTIQLAGYALRHVGLRAASVVLRRAGQDVTNYTVGGLVAGIVAWSFIAGFSGREEFIVYIGNGVTVGAFVGLGATSIAVSRAILVAANEKLSRRALLRHAHREESYR